ncbi:hypothetical protein V494_06710 [Pseudogymnoascus sp. VKM F-4513 (FW-928)]|nr:hypothetical protein V494_06710 [Pseudogymnoascus sp. VKM F-4513 (FW-928)]
MHKRLLRQHIQGRRLGDPAIGASDPEDLRLALACAGDQVLGDGKDRVAALHGAVDVGEHLCVATFSGSRDKIGGHRAAVGDG